MSTNDKTRAAPTGNKYDSVRSLMQDTGLPKETQEKVAQFARDSWIATRMAQLRHAANITQKAMAEAMGVTQGTISKLEAGKDDNITLRQIKEYARITGERIGLNFGRPLSHTEAVRLLANNLKFRLEELAKMANQNSESEIKGFLSDTFSNILNIIALCNEKLPIRDDDRIEEIRVEIVTGKKVIPETGQSVESLKEAVKV